MGITELLFLSVGLAMDAFAVSVCKGLVLTKNKTKYAFIIAALFGGFQALMPAVGWLLGKQFEHYITSVDHWVAFALLVFIGGKMIYDVFAEKDEDDCGEKSDRLDMKEVLTLSVATSIDALAVGISFAFLQVEIIKAVSIIGITTFILSVIGVAAGNMFGSRYEKKATLAGGIILILIGLKILLEHTGIIG